MAAIPSSAQLRRAVSSDLPWIRDQELLPHNRNLIGTFEVAEHGRNLVSADYVYFVLEDDGRPVAFAILRGFTQKSQSVELLRIASALPGRSHGNDLLRRIMRFVFDENGAERLWLQVVQQNSRAIAIYERLGFAREGHLRRQYMTGDGLVCDLLVFGMLRHEFAVSMAIQQDENPKMPDVSALHRRSIVFDGLIVSKWSRELFEDMQRGGLTGANCTCSLWEDFKDTMKNIGRWNGLFQENADLIVKAKTVADIRAAKQAGKTAIVLGFQNSTAFEDRIEFVELFKDAGVGVVQMAYNTQNFVCSGCYETNDSGLSDFGREIVLEMNRVGMLCDLSHVGIRSSRDVILTSKKPVAFSHCLPTALKLHARNRTDEEFRLIADHGGFVGVTMFPAFMKHGTDSTITDYIEAMEYIIDIAGEDAVGIGTDFTQGHGDDFFDYVTKDKGYGRRLVVPKPVRFPPGFETIGDYPNLTAAMEQRGWSETRVEKILGENWLRLLETVWGA